MATAFGVSSAAIDIDRISKDAHVKTPVAVYCTLEDGTSARCAKWMIRQVRYFRV